MERREAKVDPRRRRKRARMTGVVVGCCLLATSACSWTWVRASSSPVSSTAAAAPSTARTSAASASFSSRTRAPAQSQARAPAKASRRPATKGLEDHPQALVERSPALSSKVKRRARKRGADFVLKPPSGVLFVKVDPSSSATVQRHAKTWAARSTEMMVRYFGRFPVPDLLLEIRKRGSGGVGFGQHFYGERVVIRAGSGTDEKDLREDWVMPHELFHTAFPYLPRKHRWMREGLSTYLESVLRAQAGVISADAVWRRWDDRMPYGLPGPGEAGLEKNGGWGSVYWGGTFFWFLVDVRLRAETNNRVTLQHALASIVADGGNARREWPMRKVIRAVDAATQTKVFSQTYRDVALNPYAGDLESLFARLGVRVEGRSVIYDDSAPLAHVRRQLLAQKYDLNAILPLQ